MKQGKDLQAWPEASWWHGGMVGVGKLPVKARSAQCDGSCDVDAPPFLSASPEDLLARRQGWK